MLRICCRGLGLTFSSQPEALKENLGNMSSVMRLTHDYYDFENIFFFLCLLFWMHLLFNNNRRVEALAFCFKRWEGRGEMRLTNAGAQALRKVCPYYGIYDKVLQADNIVVWVIQ